MWHYIIVILLLSCPFRACIVHLNNQPKQSQQANVSSVIHIENPISPVGHVGCTFHSVRAPMQSSQQSPSDAEFLVQVKNQIDFVLSQKM